MSSKAVRKCWCQSLDCLVDGVIVSFVEVGSDEEVVEVLRPVHAHDRRIKSNGLLVSSPGV